MGPLELWGGIECSVVRLGNEWRDQLRETGHHHRADSDLALVRDLGIRTLRYPVLWERCTPGHPHACGWDWHDDRVARMDALGIAPVLGLLHHGSGPGGDGLLDPDFAEGLAAHAGRVASRYTHVRRWTPVNEPLTTARFGCLYGCWHPHRFNEDAFLRAVANQCHAVLVATRAIRRHVPDAEFVHTEDVGRVFSTPALRHQAAYENERRWLSLDLLCGVVDPAHPWHGRLEQAGVPRRTLDELAGGEARPDLIGVNHYVTSDRFLDHRQHIYPPHMRHREESGYVDTEAARVPMPAGETGWLPRLREVWNRYRRPIAVTEAHLGCVDPHEQLRWLMQAWNAATTLRAEGADIQAVTAWALFGLVDWDSMLQDRRGHYEPGVFDAPPPADPRPTLLAESVRHLAQQGHFAHPTLEQPAWWEREDRIPAWLRRKTAA